jgi:cytochrome b561
MRVTSVEPARASTPVAESTPCYDRLSILLHWLTAGLVVVLWAIAQVIDFFPKGSPRIAVRSVHILLGVLLGIVLLARVGWRVTCGKRLPPAAHGVMGRAARIVHYALYVSVAAALTFGFANVWARGDQFFELFAVPKLAPGNLELKRIVENLHGWAANFVLILAGLHVLAALVHHYVLRDDVLRRMMPGRLLQRSSRSLAVLRGPP